MISEKLDIPCLGNWWVNDEYIELQMLHHEELVFEERFESVGYTWDRIGGSVLHKYSCFTCLLLLCTIAGLKSGGAEVAVLISHP